MGILKINEANSYLKECLVNTVAEELPDKKLKIEPRLLFLSKEQFDKANNINIKYNVLKILALKFLIIELESVDYIAIIGNNNVKCENDDLEYIDIDESFYIVTAYGAKIDIKKDVRHMIYYKLFMNLKSLKYSKVMSLTHLRIFLSLLLYTNYRNYAKAI